jgi:CBS domain-containing protein
MKVRDILEKKGSVCHSISQELTVDEALNSIIDKKIGSLVVLDGETVSGIITERDILKLLHTDGDRGLTKTVREVMTTNVVIGVPDDDIETVEVLMTNNRFRHLPIMEGKKIAGIISIGDIVKIMASNFKAENRYLKDYITGKYPA